MALLDPDRLFPIPTRARDLARALYETISDLPIISPHGHCDPRWFAHNTRFPDPASLFVVPDHYVFRMLVSQGVRLDDLGVLPIDGTASRATPEQIWQTFADNFHLFRGTPSAMWLDHAFAHVFGLTQPLNAKNAMHYYAEIDRQLGQPDFLPRTLFERFNIEVLATTDSATDDLTWHKDIANSGWPGRVITTYRPDGIVDPDQPEFLTNLEHLAGLTGEDTMTWDGYLNAHRARRAAFIAMGATASDHGHPSARTENLAPTDAKTLFERVVRGSANPTEAEVFRGHMLVEMARMSLDDGLVMQIHPGSRRNHNQAVHARYGRDKGFDIPGRTDFVGGLEPLLNAVGMERDLTIIVFTLDETTYGRELAPLAGAYPALRLGPPWWFFDSFEGIKRFRETTTETCGFYNTVGFNDDTRAFCSIPARHDVARRTDCAYLAELVATGRLRESEAFELAHELTYGLAKRAYKL